MAELVQSVLHRRVGVPAVLQLEHRERQPVDEYDQIGTAVVPAADGKLVDDQEVVTLGPVPVDRVHVLMLDPATRMLDAHFNPPRQGFMERHVAANRVRPRRSREATEGFAGCDGRQIGVLLGQEGFQVVLKDDFFEWAVQLGAVGVAVAETLQPLDGGKLELGFTATARHRPMS